LGPQAGPKVLLALRGGMDNEPSIFSKINCSMKIKGRTDCKIAPWTEKSKM